MVTPRILPNNLVLNANVGLTTFQGRFEVSPDVIATELSGQTFNLTVGYARQAELGPFRLQTGAGAFYQLSTGTGVTDLNSIFGIPIVWTGIASHGPGLYLEGSVAYPFSESLAVFLNIRGAVQYSNGDTAENFLFSLNPQLGLRYFLNPAFGMNLAIGPLWGSNFQNSAVDLNGFLFQTGIQWRNRN